MAAPPKAAGRVHANVRVIVERLGSQGFSAHVVGGAVRDLLLGRSPRDFDMVSDARPEQVKRLFGNARIIGRRFRLVHLKYPDMTVELSTFRAAAPRTKGGMIVRDNIYGTPEEDAFRRDFTINALAYDTEANEVIDYVGGLADLEARTIRTITPPHVSLREDPVRMLRVVRFMVRLEFEVEPELERVMRRMPHYLLKVKRHRLSEETQRFLTRGSSAAIFGSLARFGLLVPMLGLDGHAWFFREDALHTPLPLLQPYVAALDKWVGAGREAPSATVTLLGLLIALARPEVIAVILGVEPGSGQPPVHQGVAQAGGKQRAGHPRAYHGATPTSRKVRADLPKMLGNWGLLKGQVEPATKILDAARLLLKHDLQRPAGSPPPGTREAWLLLALLRKVLALPARLPDMAGQRMAGLPVLPIFDHMPRKQGGRGNRRPKGRPAKHPVTSSGNSEGPPASAPTSSRRRRSRRGRGGRGAPRTS